MLPAGIRAEPGDGPLAGSRRAHLRSGAQEWLVREVDAWALREGGQVLRVYRWFVGDEAGPL